jgi:hypothetical protein
MELNGVYNIQQKLDKFVAQSKISAEAARELEADLILLDRYLTAVNYRPKTMWHEVKANPEKYPLNSEVQRKLWEPKTMWHEVKANPEKYPLNSEVQRKLWEAIKSESKGQEAAEKVLEEIYGEVEEGQAEWEERKHKENLAMQNRADAECLEHGM